MPVSLAERLAGAILAGEALALLLVVGWQIVALVSGDTVDVPSAIALVVLTAVGVAGLAAFAIAVWRRSSWGRSGGVVAQLLILAVALGAATGQFAHPAIAAALAAPAVVGLVLLALASRDAGRRGDPRR